MDILKRSFSRFGDGEFACMDGTGPANCDGHEYFPELRKDLLDAFNNQHSNVTYGVQRICRSRLGTEGMTDGDVFHRRSANGGMRRVINYLMDNHVVLVGPEWIMRPPLSLNQDLRIIVPSKNCYLEKERIKYDMKRCWSAGYPLFSLSCSMLAEVLIHELTPEMPGAVMIDFGSVWDPYNGVLSRSYHKKRTHKEWWRLIS